MSQMDVQAANGVFMVVVAIIGDRHVINGRQS